MGDGERDVPDCVGWMWGAEFGLEAPTIIRIEISPSASAGVRWWMHQTNAVLSVHRVHRVPFILSRTFRAIGRKSVAGHSLLGQARFLRHLNRSPFSIAVKWSITVRISTSALSAKAILSVVGVWWGIEGLGFSGKIKRGAFKTLKKQRNTKCVCLCEHWRIRFEWSVGCRSRPGTRKWNGR